MPRQESAKDPVAFVQGLLSLRDKYDRIVNDAFRGEKRSQKRLKEVYCRARLFVLGCVFFFASCGRRLLFLNKSQTAVEWRPH